MWKVGVLLKKSARDRRANLNNIFYAGMACPGLICRLYVPGKPRSTKIQNDIVCVSTLPAPAHILWYLVRCILRTSCTSIIIRITSCILHLAFLVYMYESSSSSVRQGPARVACHQRLPPKHSDVPSSHCNQRMLDDGSSETGVWHSPPSKQYQVPYTTTGAIDL